MVAKLGALNITYCGFGWEKRPKPPTSEKLGEATRRYYEPAIEAFGPNRCMFESNFLVDKVNCSDGVPWNSFKHLAASYAPTERVALLNDKAAQAYGIWPAPKCHGSTKTPG